MAYSMMGSCFYKLLQQRGLVDFEALGVRYVYATISDAHLRLMGARPVCASRCNSSAGSGHTCLFGCC